MKNLLENNSRLLAGLFTFSLYVVVNNGGTIELSDNYLIHYNFCDDRIDFHISVSNVSGWIGLGFNNKSADMDGSDLFIAGAVHAGHYDGDYHVPSNAGNGLPVLDASQDWFDIGVSWYVDGRTYVDASRLLDTADIHDIPIKNEPIYLLWAYNEHSDDVTEPHTHSGYVSVNLLRYGNCEDVTDFISLETESATEPLPTTTEPTPGICPPSGTDLVEHPTSCSHYYVCVEGTAYERECVDELHFNPSIKACDLPENVNCTKPLPECPSGGVSFHPYPGNCSLYVICAEGTPSVWGCAPETCFDPEILECRRNNTVTAEVPRQVMVAKGSTSYWEAVIRCERDTTREPILVESNRSPQEFHVCQGKQYKATFTCSALYKFDAEGQKCVSDLGM